MNRSTAEEALLIARLETRRQHLLAEISGQLRQHDAEVEAFRSGDVHDRGETSVAMQDDDNASALDLHLRAELDAVQDALTRVAEGTYGRCTRCRAEIPTARLRAQPEASRCTRCQAAAEAP